MKLSNDAVTMLRWLRKHDKWSYIEEIEQGYKKYDFRSLSALTAAGLVDAEVFEADYENPVFDPDYGESYREHYRISDAGKAHLDMLSSSRWPEVRAWVTLLISVLALFVSIVALISK